MVTLRAVEQRRWIIRASTAGPSALIDPFGRVIRRTSLLSETVLAGTVQPLDGTTLYGRIGDVFAWLCVGVTACVCLLTRRARRSSATDVAECAAHHHEPARPGARS
jgi:apolipoprotein N-acyltransferase